MTPDPSIELPAQAAPPVPGDAGFRIFDANAAIKLIVEPSDGSIVYASQAAATFYGYSVGRLREMRIADVNCNPAPVVAALLARAMRGDESFTAIHRLADGTTREVGVQTGPIEIGGRRLLFSVITDRTPEREAQVARERLVEILEATSDVVSTAALDGTITYLNRAGRELFGASDDADDPGLAAIAEAHPEWALRRIQEEGIPTAMREGTWRGETALLLPDGSELPVSQVILCHRDPRGAPAYLSTVVRDLSEQKRAEREAVRTAERMQMIATAAAAVIATHSLEELQRAVSSACRTVIPYDAFLLASYDEATHTLTFPATDDAGALEGPETLPVAETPAERVIRERRSLLTRRADDPASWGARTIGTGRRSESVIRTPVVAGERVLGLVSVQSYQPELYSDADVRVMEVVASIVASAMLNIRAHRENEEVRASLERSERHFRRFFEEDISADYIATVDGTVTECNPAFARILGFASVEEAIGVDIRHFYPDPAVRAGILEELARGEVVEGRELLLHRIDGTPVHVLKNVSAERDDAGRITFTRAYLVDMTEHKKLEEQLRQALKMEAVGRLAGGIAHDFNNLLTSITGHARLVIDDLAPQDPLRPDLEEVLRSADRAATLTRQLLAFSRRQVIQPRVIDPNRVVAEMERMLQRMIGEDVQLVTELAEEVHHTLADPSQVEQVLMNLAVNARDAMPAGGRLWIRTANARLEESLRRTHPYVVPGEYVLLEVADTGSGMDAATLGRIFEPFFTTKEVGQGTGLGLSTVYGIVKQSGGFIWADSAPGEGTTFRIYLPRAEPRPEENGAAAVLPELVRGSETVLLVEDADAVRALARKILTRSGYRVVEASNGVQALRLFERNPEAIDLVVTDVVMPEMAGPEMVARIRALRPGFPVLFMSGYAEDRIVHHGVVATDLLFLDKPFAPDALTRAVREALGDARPGGEAASA